MKTKLNKMKPAIKLRTKTAVCVLITLLMLFGSPITESVLTNGSSTRTITPVWANESTTQLTVIFNSQARQIPVIHEDGNIYAYLQSVAILFDRYIPFDDVANIWYDGIPKVCILSTAEHFGFHTEITDYNVNITDYVPEPAATPTPTPVDTATPTPVPIPVPDATTPFPTPTPVDTSPISRILGVQDYTIGFPELRSWYRFYSIDLYGHQINVGDFPFTGIRGSFTERVGQAVIVVYGDEMWQLRIDVGADPDGRRRYHHIVLSEDDVNALVTPEPRPPRVATPRVYSGFVDERYELIYLINRLAGKENYSPNYTEYQQLLNSTFRGFRNHPVVAARNRVGWTVNFLAMHMEWDGGEWIFMEVYRPSRDDISFLEELNNFYRTSGFRAFFNQHIPYYLEHSQRFYDDVVSQMNLEWFRQHEVNPDNVQIVLSPGVAGFGASGQIGRGQFPLDEVIIFSITSVEIFDSTPRSLKWVIAHEIAHSFDEIGTEWYRNNSQFRRWAVRANNYLVNNRGWYRRTDADIARELVSDAFAFWYMYENTDYTLDELFSSISHMPLPYVRYTTYKVMGR